MNGKTVLISKKLRLRFFNAIIIPLHWKSKYQFQRLTKTFEIQAGLGVDLDSRKWSSNRIGKEQRLIRSRSDGGVFEENLPYHELESDEAENSKILRVSAEERKNKVIPLRQRVGQVNLHENTRGKEFYSIVFSCFGSILCRKVQTMVPMRLKNERRIRIPAMIDA